VMDTTRLLRSKLIPFGRTALQLSLKEKR